MKLSLVQENFGTLFSFPFLRNSPLEISVDLVSFRKSQRPWSIYSLPASQVEAIEVEIFSSNQGSRKVKVNSSIAISSRSVSITFESSKASKEVPPGSIEASAKLLFVAIANVKRCTLSFLVLLPITINSLDRWTSPASVSRPSDAATPPRHLLPQPYSRR
jgi:hypothetical protein